MKKQQVIYHRYHNSITNSEQFVYSGSIVNRRNFLTRLDTLDYIAIVPRRIGEVTYQPLSQIKTVKESVEEKSTVKSSK